MVGFDDNPLARRARPALTTVRQDRAEKGRVATAALTAEIDRRRRDDRRTRAARVLPPELVVRASTAAAPDGRSDRCRCRRW